MVHDLQMVVFGLLHLSQNSAARAIVHPEMRAQHLSVQVVQRLYPPDDGGWSPP